MKLKTIITTLLLTFAAGLGTTAQEPIKGDVFVPIAKYIRQGDVPSLSAWFADNLEISIISSTNDSSRKQARQILKSFFDEHTPRAFEITHQASSGNMKYALGSLTAGVEVLQVTLFPSLKGDTYQIQQFKIERITY